MGKAGMLKINFKNAEKVGTTIWDQHLEKGKTNSILDKVFPRLLLSYADRSVFSFYF